MKSDELPPRDGGATAYLSLGSNLGDRAGFLRRALERLEELGVRVMRVSRLYETAPRELLDQPDFLNRAAEVEFSSEPEDLLEAVRQVEGELGRQRAVEKGPRTIDIDILLIGDLRITTEVLEVPHPRMHERGFVLAPMAELAPDLEHPVLHRRMSELLEEVADQEVRSLGGDQETRGGRQHK